MNPTNRSLLVVWLVVAAVPTVWAADPKVAPGEDTVLFRRAVTEDTELVFTRGPDRPVASLAVLTGPVNVERLDAVWELRVQLVTKDGPTLTLMTQLRPVSKPGEVLAPPGWNFKGLKTVTEYAVLDVAWRPIEVNEMSMFSEEIVFAARVDGALILTRLRPLGGNIERVQLEGWHAYSTAVVGDPSAAKLSKAEGLWVVEVTSGHVTAPRVTKFKQVSREEWKFDQLKE